MLHQIQQRAVGHELNGPPAPGNGDDLQRLQGGFVPPDPRDPVAPADTFRLHLLARLEGTLPGICPETQQLVDRVIHSLPGLGVVNVKGHLPDGVAEDIDAAADGGQLHGAFLVHAGVTEPQPQRCGGHDVFTSRNPKRKL